MTEGKTMQQRVPEQDTRIAQWAGRLAALPKRNALALARATLEEARAAANSKEREYQENAKRIIALGNVLNDAEASRAEAAAIAAKVKWRKAATVSIGAQS